MKRPKSMAFGKRKSSQDELFILTAKVATGPAHPFYSKLNEALGAAGFDVFVETLRAPYYREGGWPGIPPGVYFRGRKDKKVGGSKQNPIYRQNSSAAK